MNYSSVKVWKTMLQVLDTTRGHTPREVLKTEGLVFPSKNQLTLVNNMFIFPKTQLNVFENISFIS